MAVLQVLEYPDPRLKRIAAPVVAFDQTLWTLLEEMRETMYAEDGIGLAAVQVGVPLQVVVVDCSEQQNVPLQLINPQIIEQSGETETTEGCLSLPGVYEEITRPDEVKVTFMDATGVAQVETFTGLVAVCVQHEIDHLQGHLFVERLSRLKQQRVLKKFRKQQLESQREGCEVR